MGFLINHQRIQEYNIGKAWMKLYTETLVAINHLYSRFWNWFKEFCKIWKLVFRDSILAFNDPLIILSYIGIFFCKLTLFFPWFGYKMTLKKTKCQQQIKIYEVSSASIYLFKVNNRRSWKLCEICSKLTIKRPERRHWFWTVKCLLGAYANIIYK